MIIDWLWWEQLGCSVCMRSACAEEMFVGEGVLTKHPPRRWKDPFHESAACWAVVWSGGACSGTSRATLVIGLQKTWVLVFICFGSCDLLEFEGGDWTRVLVWTSTALTRLSLPGYVATTLPMTQLVLKWLSSVMTTTFPTWMVRLGVVPFAGALEDLEILGRPPFPKMLHHGSALRPSVQEGVVFRNLYFRVCLQWSTYKKVTSS